MENPVLTFLKEHEENGYTFDEGVAVLLAYSAKTHVNTFIIARRDRRHLAAELGRLAHVPNLKAVPGRTVPVNQPKATAPTEEVTAPTTAESEPGNGDGVPADGEVVPEVPENLSEIVTYLDIDRYETYNPDDLPTPMLKELWIKNRDDFKELCYSHQQMKLANSDAGRAEWRFKVISLRDTIKKRWELFKEEMDRVKAENGEGAEPKNPAYNPLNDRAYISKALKKEDWDDKTKVEVQRRVDALLKHEMTISTETRQKLEGRGITL